ncbi:MAG: PfkB family carbohydrate kinase, partial [Acutalibacteraceae bacterium]
MIYTVTLNPSLDCVTRLDRFQPGALNRAAGQRITFGGKGLNVSVMLRRLGVDSTALGFAAGSTGRELERLVQKEGIDPAFVTLD